MTGLPPAEPAVPMGSRPRDRIRAGMGFWKKSSKHFRRSSEDWLLR